MNYRKIILIFHFKQTLLKQTYILKTQLSFKNWKLSVLCFHLIIDIFLRPILYHEQF